MNHYSETDVFKSQIRCTHAFTEGAASYIGVVKESHIKSQQKQARQSWSLPTKWGSIERNDCLEKEIQSLMDAESWQLSKFQCMILYPWTYRTNKRTQWVLKNTWTSLSYLNAVYLQGTEVQFWKFKTICNSRLRRSRGHLLTLIWWGIQGVHRHILLDIKKKENMCKWEYIVQESIMKEREDRRRARLVQNTLFAGVKFSSTEKEIYCYHE